MTSYVFPGFPSFLQIAEAELGLQGSAGPASRISALTDLANLCAQASLSNLSHVEGILAKATGFRDQIATALRAAELMLAEVEGARRSVSKIEHEPEPETDSPPSPEPRSGRKVARNERLTS